MARNYCAIPHDYLEEMEQLTDEEFGRLIRGLLSYSQTGEAISPAGNERFYVKRVINTENAFQQAFEDTDIVKSERAKKAAAARWHKADECTSILEDAQASVSTSSNAKNAININKSNIIKSTPKERKSKERKKDAEFDRFWECYPRKVGKGAARTAFEKVHQNGVPVETLISAVEKQRQSKQWIRDDGQYIPHPATWLNQERWEDSVEAVQQDERKVVDMGDLDWLLTTQQAK